MTLLGTALRPAATKVMLLGSGELGKEVAIECQRLGIETIAVDRYPDAPAMQVAHRSHVINMLHGDALRELIALEKPDYIVPEIEAIATDTLVELEQAGQKVVPTARAAKLTMNREGIRRLAAEELQIPTSAYRFADSEEGFRAAVDGVHFCAPVGHRQEDGDYRESWQPQQMSDLALQRAQEIARKVVLALGGYGLFGVELFVCGDEVIFSEVSPRPHDTGMVTLISQDLSEFALHVRAFLGLPIGAIRQYGPAASAVILPQLTSENVTFSNLQAAVGAGLQLRLFGKPEIAGARRLGVTLAVADNVDEAISRAKTAAAAVVVKG